MQTPPQSPSSRTPSPPSIRRTYGRSSFTVQTPPPEEPEEEQPVLEENVPDNVNDWNVRFSRSQPRVGGMVCVEVEISATGAVEKWPLEAFIDGDFFTNDTVCEMVNDWNATAASWPNVKRLCLMCCRKATKGLTICGHCEFKGHGQAIYG